MAAEQQPPMMSVEEYFELEKKNPEICYEYVDGYVYMMAGGTFNHDTIKANIQGMIWAFLLQTKRACRVQTSDMKTYISETRYFHPDVVVTCDPRDRGTGDRLKYPRVVFEVLSPSTELADRTWKMQTYLALPTLEEYILVDSKACKVELYRKEQEKWIYSSFGPNDQLELKNIDLHFAISDTYINTDFENEE